MAYCLTGVRRVAGGLTVVIRRLVALGLFAPLAALVVGHLLGGPFLRKLI